jgi:hypothetical protein
VSSELFEHPEFVGDMDPAVIEELGLWRNEPVNLRRALS